MRIVVLKEVDPGETRVPVTPQVVDRYTRLGAKVYVERGVGERVQISDSEYEAAGAELGDRAELLGQAQLLLHVAPLSGDVVSALKEGVITAGFLDPFFQPQLVGQLAQRKVNAVAMELIPRSTYAQKMDALSSQASLAGYAAVIVAAERSPQAFPMMSTPAGTIPPVRVLVIGAGVAGLQAIATAKRLGARVEAYDTRPVVKEQVQSLGAKFVEIDVGETGQTEQGYARELTPEQLESQRKQMARICAHSDIIITTAQVFGRQAPTIITKSMVADMKPGSVIVDLAATTGGNVEGTRAGEEVRTDGGVLIVGPANMPGQVARDASQMYANNLYFLLEHAWDKEAGRLALDTEDAVIGACLLTSGGAIRDERVAALLEGKR